MALSAAFTDNASIGATEISLPRNASYDVAQYQTGDGIYQLELAVAAIAAGDQFEIKIYEAPTSAGTQGLVEAFFIDGVPASPTVQIDLGILGHKWDVTVKKIAGTDRTVHWTIWQVS